MIDVMPHAEGSVLPVRAQPAARKNGIVGEHGGMLKVAVTAAAERGKANQALVDLLAKNLGVKRSQIDLLSGQTSHDKRFLIRGVSPAQLQAKLVSRLA